jgi:hypothetical protein
MKCQVFLLTFRIYFNIIYSVNSLDLLLKNSTKNFLRKVYETINK